MGEEIYIFETDLLFFEKEEQAMVYELRTLEFSRLPLPTQGRPMANRRRSDFHITG